MCGAQVKFSHSAVRSSQGRGTPKAQGRGDGEGAVMASNGSQQLTRLLRVGNSGAVLSNGWGERAPEVARRVEFRSACSNRVLKNLLPPGLQVVIG